MKKTTSDEEKDRLFGFVSRIPGQISSIIGFLTIVIGTVLGITNWLGGKTGLAVYIAVAASVVIIWEIALYVILKKDTKRISSFPKGARLVKHPSFSSRTRRVTLASAILLTAIAGTGVWYWRHLQNLPPSKTVILVADFLSLDGQNYGVTEKLIEHLRDSLSRFPDIQVQALKKSITAQEGSEEAHIVAKDNKAAIFLWGWYRKTPENVLITTHFEVLQRPYLLRLKQEKQELNSPAKAFETFQVQTQLSNEIDYITLLTTGLARFEVEDYSNAIDLFGHAIAQNAAPTQMVDPANIYYFRGTAYLHVRDYDKAISDLDKSLKLTPENFCTPCAYNNLGVAYSSKGNYDEAIRNFRRGLGHAPDHITIRYNLAFNYSLTGAYDQAIAELSRIKNQDVNDSLAAYRLGVAYLDKQDYENAIKEFSEAIRLDPNDASAFTMRAVAYGRKGETDKALYDYEEAIRLNGDLATIYTIRASMYSEKGEVDKALADYKEAINVNNFPGAFYNRAQLYFRLDKYDSAIADLTQVISLQPDHAEAYHRRGLAFQSLGNHESAIRDYKLYLHFARDEKSREDAKKHLQESTWDK